MTIINKNVKRDVIPRWRLSSIAGKQLESLPAMEVRDRGGIAPQKTPKQMLDEYRSSGKPLMAAEALSAAIVDGDSEVALSAAQLLKGHVASMPLLREIVSRIVSSNGAIGKPSGEFDSSSASAHRNVAMIAKYKELLRIYPKNPMAWLDMGFLYTGIGQKDLAKNAVMIASSLDPNHRTIARASSRFYVHAGDFDQALHVINKSDLVKSDPWLVSAHIATARAGGRSSSFVGLGRRMFKDEIYRSDQLSELGAALATNEVEHGNYKLADKLVRKALIDPTENAVAQISWLEAVQNISFNTGAPSSVIANAWEARTFESFERQEWVSSCKEASLWLADQPFSSRPAIHGSYVASTYLMDYDLALTFSEAGYKANPDDVIVVNNYVVSLAEKGRVKEARRIFSDRLRNSLSAHAMLRATEGLLLYREGDLVGARASYDMARAHFSTVGDSRSELLATIFQSREEAMLGNIGETKALLSDLVERTVKISSPDHLAILELAKTMR